MRIPLSIIEQYLFWEDRPAYPWSCFFRLNFDGVIERQEIEAAIAKALERNPLMRSKVTVKTERKLYWEIDEHYEPQITFSNRPPEEYPGAPTLEYLDLTKEIGTRFFVETSENKSNLLIQFHHACCDGGGILSFADELMIAYAREMGLEVEFPKVSASKLGKRAKFPMGFLKRLKDVRKQLVGLAGIRQFIQRDPQPIVRHQARQETDALPPSYPNMFTRAVGLDESTQLRAFARTTKVRLNDLLIRDLFLTLYAWRKRNTDFEDATWIRMLVPMNLRTSFHRDLSAANVVSSIFLDRNGQHLECDSDLLKGIHDEMNLIKDNNLGQIFLHSLRLCRWFPGLKKTARRDECTNTCILTNIGKPFNRSRLPKKKGKLSPGNLILENIECAAPIRPYNCISFTVMEYAKQLYLTLHFDSRFLSPEAANDIMNQFIERLRAPAKD